jgi:hypothetical protein
MFGFLRGCSSGDEDRREKCSTEYRRSHGSPPDWFCLVSRILDCWREEPM